MTESVNTAPVRLSEDAAVERLLTPTEDSVAAPEEVEVIAEKSAKEVTSKTESKEVEEEVEEAEASPDSETDPEDEDDGEEEEDSESPSEGDEELAEAEEEDTEVMYTLSDGEEVTLDELKRGHLRQSDYTQKTQALAEDRQAFDSTVHELGTERNITAEALMMAMNIVEPKLAQGAQTNWEALANEDAYEYAEKWAEYQQAQVRWTQLQNAGVQATQAQAQQDAVHKQASQAHQAKALQMAIPDLADPTKAKALQASLREYAQTSGLSEDEASNISDHRVVILLNKARLYDEMVDAGQTVVKKKLSKSPKRVLKPGQPVTKSEKQATSKKAARDNVRAKGTDEAAMAWLLSG
jgi:hypothetical protein